MLENRRRRITARERSRSIQLSTVALSDQVSFQGSDRPNPTTTLSMNSWDGIHMKDHNCGTYVGSKRRQAIYISTGVMGRVYFTGPSEIPGGKPSPWGSTVVTRHLESYVDYLYSLPERWWLS